VLDILLPDVVHQGFLGLAREFNPVPLEDLLKGINEEQQPGLILVADHITDEGNLGALIRSAVFFGVNGLILPKDRSAWISETVKKRSSGAYVYLPVSRVVNISRALDQLDKSGFWIIGTDERAEESIYQFDWNRKVALILGNEERGLSQVARKKCHQLVKIPSQSSLGSLNVSVSGAVILAEILRQRQQGDRP
jgi:23S rRNA (guanosine2251-2'-O)-methyltransferase